MLLLLSPRRMKSDVDQHGFITGVRSPSSHPRCSILLITSTSWTSHAGFRNTCVGTFVQVTCILPPCPCIVKSRLLTEDNSNSVILKLDKLRHFLFVHDRKSFREKQDKVIFRGKIRSSRVRTAFLKKFINHPVFDCGVVESREDVPKEWERPKRTIREHLDYKFIMALEGNDVASNLKWVMSSNCLAVMTRPTCETWFMEGSLIAGYHYVEVKEDFSDLEEKIRYYTEHIQEAEDIIAHAHEYVSQFMDKEREEIIQLLVLQKYLRLSGQY